ncbi:MAG: hypothetical protein AAFQ80_23190 [Cyanobacteria bacterium J06621_8]
MAGFDCFMRLSQFFVGFVEKFSDCKFTKYSVKDYLDNSTLEQAYEYSFAHLSRNLGWKFMSENIEDNIHILVVKKSPSNIVPKQLTTYSIPFDIAYIFVRDEPEKIKGVGKFFINHEIGHTLYVASREKMRVLIGSKTILFFLFWSLWFIHWNYQSFLVAIALVITSITMLREWNRRINKINLEDEMWADVFAVASLSTDERVRVSRYFSRYPFPPDSRMDEQQNALRVQNLKSNLEKADKNHSIGNKKIPRLFTFDNKFDIYAPLEIVTTAILMLSLATYSQEPTIKLSIKVFFLIDLPLLALLVLIAFICQYTKHTINHLLKI